MTKVQYPSGLVLEWDDTITVGELIAAHDSGYHVLTRIEFREEETPLFHYVMVVREDGTRVKKPGVTRVCDAVYCRRLTREDVLKLYTHEHNAAIIKRDNLLNFLPQ